MWLGRKRINRYRKEAERQFVEAKRLSCPSCGSVEVKVLSWNPNYRTTNGERGQIHCQKCKRFAQIHIPAQVWPTVPGAVQSCISANAAAHGA